jgi:hypothetical protein
MFKNSNRIGKKSTKYNEKKPKSSQNENIKMATTFLELDKKKHGNPIPIRRRRSLRRSRGRHPTLPAFHLQPILGENLQMEGFENDWRQLWKSRFPGFRKYFGTPIFRQRQLNDQVREAV